MGSLLFPRAWKVQVDTLDVSNLDIEFKILATLAPLPNKGVVTVWNLNQDHRAQLLKRNRPDPNSSKIVGIPVQVEAGYNDNTATILSADLREVGSKLDWTAWKTTLSGDDGGRAFREARVNVCFKKGTQVSTILKQVCQAMGIGIGNASDFAEAAEINGYGSQIPHSMTFSGPASKELTRLLKSIGLDWSIQRGALQLRERGKPINAAAITLSPSTGLLGSPEASMDATVSFGNPQQFAPGATPKVAKPKKPKDTSIVKLRAMMIPGIVPGRKITLDSEEFQGGYMLTECEYVGKTWDQKTWYVDCVARVY